MLLLGSDVHGATLGIVGFGRIGRAVARRAIGFGMSVLYHSRSRAPESVEAELGATAVGLDELLERSDIVSIHVSLNPETRGLIGGRAARPDEAHGGACQHRPRADRGPGRAGTGARRRKDRRGRARRDRSRADRPGRSAAPPAELHRRARTSPRRRGRRGAGWPRWRPTTSWPGCAASPCRRRRATLRSCLGDRRRRRTTTASGRRAGAARRPPVVPRRRPGLGRRASTGWPGSTSSPGRLHLTARDGATRTISLPSPIGSVARARRAAGWPPSRTASGPSPRTAPSSAWPTSSPTARTSASTTGSATRRAGSGPGPWPSTIAPAPVRSTGSTRT